MRSFKSRIIIILSILALILLFLVIYTRMERESIESIDIVFLENTYLSERGMTNHAYNNTVIQRIETKKIIKEFIEALESASIVDEDDSLKGDFEVFNLSLKNRWKYTDDYRVYISQDKEIFIKKDEEFYTINNKSFFSNKNTFNTHYNLAEPRVNLIDNIEGKEINSKSTIYTIFDDRGDELSGDIYLGTNLKMEELIRLNSLSLEIENIENQIKFTSSHEIDEFDISAIDLKSSEEIENLYIRKNSNSIYVSTPNEEGIYEYSFITEYILEDSNYKARLNVNIFIEVE